MNKMNKLFLAGFLAALSLLVACKHSTTLKDVAGYVGKRANGLTVESQVERTSILCQYIPAKEARDEDGRWVYRFRILLKNTEAGMPDSLLYGLNYHSSDLFGLAQATDTLRPVLSERIANGRKDSHEFTVLFASGRQVSASGAFHLLIYKNPLVSRDLSLDYRYADITKASKKLYGYEQVEN